jgi:hypothetical protein
MDEDYARKLRAWLRAEPGATPHRAEEEREWLREVPTPVAEGGWVAGEQLPAPVAEGGWPAGDRHPAQAADGGWAGEQPPAPAPASGDACAAADRIPAPQPDPDERWTVRGQLPELRSDTDEDWVCPVIELPVPRSSQENGCRMSGAEARSRWNHPTNWHRRLRQQEEPGSR